MSLGRGCDIYSATAGKRSSDLIDERTEFSLKSKSRRTGRNRSTHSFGIKPATEGMFSLGRTARRAWSGHSLVL
jgi:hypothetical protein